MAISEGYLEFALDQLRSFGNVTAKKMFGGAGLYFEGVMFGLIADDVLYLKVDDSNRADYVAEGMGPFRPLSEKKSQVMSYYEVPLEVLESEEALRQWAAKALTATFSSASSLWEKVSSSIPLVWILGKA